MRNLRHPCLALLQACLLSLFCAACSSLQVVEGDYATRIHPGDTVQVITQDGRTLTFEVARVSDSGISGDGQAVSYDHIARLEKQDISTTRTVGLVLGILAAGALVGGSDSGGSSY